MVRFKVKIIGMTRKKDGEYMYGSIRKLSDGKLLLTVTDITQSVWEEPCREHEPEGSEGVLAPADLSYVYNDLLDLTKDWQLQEAHDPEA